MSTPRNTPTSLRRRRNVAGAVALILVPTAAGLAACSIDQQTGPRSAVAAQSNTHAAAPNAQAAPAPPPPPGPAPAPPPGPAPKPSPVDSAARMTLPQLLADTATWQTTPDAIQPGTDTPLPLQCGVSGSYTVSAPIGPNGGQLQFGKSALIVPKGALSQTTQITANITLGGSVQVTFLPHGLQFNKPVQIVADFTGCTMPAGGAVNVYYTNDSGGIVQTMPSAAAPSAPRVTALTDHFSGYAIAWGRF